MLVVMIFIVNYTTAQEQKDTYYPNSVLLKETGKLDANGYPTGEWKYYQENGNIDYIIDWETNYIKSYFPEGGLKEEGTFIPETGVHIGKWITYNKNGKIETEKTFDENGNEIKM